MSREKLKRYFSNITYIDDLFDYCFIGDTDVHRTEGEATPYDEAEDEGPPLSESQHTDVEESPPQSAPVTSPTSKDQVGNNLVQLLVDLNDDKYANITVNPVLYCSETNTESLCTQILKAPLTMIDWMLSEVEDKNAYPIIRNVLQETQQLKVIVVYTASYAEALKALDNDAYLKQFKRIDKPGLQNLSYCFCNCKSLLIFADKQQYSILTLLDIIVDIFISACGVMPVAVLDYVQRVQDLSDKLFGAFSDPIADLYFLQMYYSELNEYDATEAMTMFMQNKFRDACTVDSRILQELYQLQKNRLKIYIASGTAEIKLHSSIDYLIPHLGDLEKAFCQALKKVPFSSFRRCCDDAVIQSLNWFDVVDYFTSFFQEAKEIYIKDQINFILRPYLGLELPFVFEEPAEQQRNELQKTIAQNISESFENFRRQICPLLLQMLISSSQMLTTSEELVRNVKYKCYENTSLKELLEEGAEYDEKQKTSFLINKIHFGDVLVKYDKHKGNEYLLCLTPPCDAFRPGKTKLNLLFIRGNEVHSKELNSRRKENSHLSALPVKNKHKTELRYINWKFFDIVKFNLKNVEEYKALCGWERPYMMAEPYARQIANAFTAYFSRAGVDELFMKSENNLRRLFK